METKEKQETGRVVLSVEQLLRGVPLFAGLDENTVKLIASRCRRRIFAPRTDLFHQDDPGNTLYLIAGGHVNIQTIGPEGEVVHIARRGRGEPIGELSLLDGQGRSADAVTGAEPCDLVMLDRDAFLGLIDEQPLIARNVIASLASRLREAATGTTNRQTRDVAGRLSEYLLIEAEAYGQVTSNNSTGTAAAATSLVSLRLNMTQGEIGTLIGAKRETVSRALSRLRSSGAIRENADGSLTLHRKRLEKLRDGC